jgi:hypothetical protein
MDDGHLFPQLFPVDGNGKKEGKKKKPSLIAYGSCPRSMVHRLWSGGYEEK